MPPETSVHPDSVMSPSDQQKKLLRRRFSVIVVSLVLLTGVGYTASRVFANVGVPKPTPTPKVAPPVTADERSKVADKPLGPTQLDVTALNAQNADIVQLLAKALQVATDVTVQGSLIVGTNGTFGGTIQAQNFVGSGAQLTGVNADLLAGQPGSYYSGLATGVSALSANAALRTADNTFTSANAFNAGLTTVALTTPARSPCTGPTSSMAVRTTISSLVLGRSLYRRPGRHGA